MSLYLFHPLTIAKAAGILALSFLSACSGSKPFSIPATPPPDNLTIDKPASRDINPAAESFDKQITMQLEQSLDLSRNLRTLFGKRKEAQNTNAFDEVFNSSWFTNRHHLFPMSDSDFLRGPDSDSGPAMEGKWTIISAKSQGVTPGFAITDSDGTGYLLKFDPKGYRELASGAEVVSTTLFHAMGYNVPENHIVIFDPQMLKLGENVSFTDSYGVKRKMNEADLDEIFAKIDFLPDGRIRALASKFIEGKLLGPFRYKSTRKDDANDFIPHQHRRELRSLRLISAWLNHFDTKDGNSLDVYVDEHGRRYVKHYLIDFGATLGSASWGPNHIWRGHENDFDPNQMATNLLTLGLKVQDWERKEEARYPSVGVFESEMFDPGHYKPQIPNPAFENMTDRDAFWAARLIMAFSNDQLRLAVQKGQYSDQRAQAYLLATLIERRDKIGRHAFARLSPLDRFTLTGPEDSSRLAFTNLEELYELRSRQETNYRYSIADAEGETLLPPITTTDTFIDLPAASGNEGRQIVVYLQSDSVAGKWKKGIHIFLEPLQSGSYRLLGLKRN